MAEIFLVAAFASHTRGEGKISPELLTVLACLAAGWGWCLLVAGWSCCCWFFRQLAVAVSRRSEGDRRERGGGSARERERMRMSELGFWYFG